MLPFEVMQQVHNEWFSWNQSGLSAVEISHREKNFEAMIHQTKDLLRQLLAIPENYQVIFLQGGATLVWSSLPMNIAWGKKAGYVVSGMWSQKAFNEAKKYLNPDEVANSNCNGFFYDYPNPAKWNINPEYKYLHYCSNETIQGIQFPTIPSIDIPLACDMSSDILSRKIDVTKFGAIYAGAQKNMGVAGLTVLIIRKDWLDLNHEKSNLIPRTLNYQNVSEQKSLVNTPCTFAIYVCNLVLKWLKSLGGVAEIEKINNQKAMLLYDYLDNNDFYQTTIKKEARSKMNVTFKLRNESLQEKFIRESDSSGLKQLKGHRLQGGLRASIYNSMPIAGVETLIDFLEDFAKKNN